MPEGLKPHHHQYYHHKTKHYFDSEKGCMIKMICYRCMICGKIYHERYEYKSPPNKEKTKRKFLTGTENKLVKKEKRKETAP